MVGQSGSGSGMESGTADAEGSQENSASVLSAGGWMFAGVGSAIILGSGLL